MAHKQKYADFFDEIIDSQLDPLPHILMPTLLLSEIVNTYLRSFAAPAYADETGHVIDDFKKDYRGTSHCTQWYERLMDDIGSYGHRIRYIDDRSLVADAANLLNKSIGVCDYNDYLYYILCKELNKSERTVILTHDGDYLFEDIELISANKRLLHA
jgi:hypothetical protein